MEQQQQENEEYSVETPLPPAFLPYDQNGAALSYAENDAENVQHGRSPRFYMLLLAAVVIVTVAIGTGVGVGMSGGSSNNSSVSSATVTAFNEEVSAGNSDNSFTPTNNDAGDDPSREDKLNGDATPGDAVEFGNTGTYGVEPETATTPTTTTTGEVMDILKSFARFNGQEFNDPISYQSKAARWVESTATVGVHTPQRLVQRYALASLYYSTNAVQSLYTDEIFGVGNPPRGWIDETGWLVDANECTWYQVTCNAEGFVTKIQLHQNRLTGTFPEEIALLADTLEVVDLYQNLVHNEGPAGNDWLGELTQLKQLFYGRTYFQYDGIPAAIGKLTNLEELDCSYTLYHGPLRGEAFVNLTNLEYLHIGGNGYNTSIPYELAQLPELQFLYSEFADITGDLSFIQKMPKIVELWVDKNPMLGGTLPTEIGLATTLRSFSITDCGLVGTIPTELSNLRLQQAWFYGNDLVGSMPQAVCDTRYPNGKLMDLVADCNDDVFTCDCCTKCGAPDDV